MSKITFYKDYKDNEKLRNSFNELAMSVFGIHFEDWYQNNYWKHRYIPYSYVQNDHVIANISVNQVDLIINNEKKRAIQIGTVMTHPDYRNRGLSGSLMNKVLEEYKNKSDFIYLFSNNNVLDFYPKFGFKPVHEYQFSMECLVDSTEVNTFRKLDGTSVEDLHFIYHFALERIPVSKRFSTANTQELLMYYCIYVFNNHIYYLQDEQAIVIFRQEGHQLDIFDIVSKKEVNINKILSTISNQNTKKIVFHYTPDYQAVNLKREILNEDDLLFVKTNGNEEFPSYIKHPITSQA
ncbi:GNAT family N-acetyltransferase [Alkalihalobacillus hemicellulosilyticus]|uniref:Acetyltransferase n=1 Tax=Halalkalibacter hemicellulosilyticusJCM 9152 TaxID=1236971 RepID=W4QDL9_9BACI|nr:GNAT family N-acetyltransferase [Halalkalibacter hemicellulosilyticus]GAE29434.1 acetyltransferase [Halalkalibacter hemicellulosilyticusJCM 9152]